MTGGLSSRVEASSTLVCVAKETIMFYCNECAKKNEWPDDAIMRSFGLCEICGLTADCNDITAKFLPLPKEPVNESIYEAMFK